MTYVIGLTGGIGSGKSTVAKLFSDKGVTVIDTDQLARDVTAPDQPALQLIQKKFGKEILLPDGNLNRSLLRQMIFDDPAKRIWLEQLLHPLIRTELKRLAEASASPYCIAVIPLLFETQPNPLINRVLTIDLSEEDQIQRTQIRDKLSPEAVHAILKTQASRELRREKADDIIYNHGSIEDLVSQVDQLHQAYLLLAKSQSS